MIWTTLLDLLTEMTHLGTAGITLAAAASPGAAVAPVITTRHEPTACSQIEEREELVEPLHCLSGLIRGRPDKQLTAVRDPMTSTSTGQLGSELSVVRGNLARHLGTERYDQIVSGHGFRMLLSWSSFIARESVLATLTDEGGAILTHFEKDDSACWR
ncbi:hypothetical protein [Amycolatopsis regifaucium]|uniref:Uncharacterized protein n=1 Tax=Amycolatopsis regifaucium TaxID=546365 RepID=A0A154MF85_9PSEU|nr:hypothetical protein [Amycolatopsis regifaucium]KZB83122.1 hypothetical protein AVL48_36505 [Amycolatopsis regifaucium]OKA03223.1 hypothetical protein ATP06_0237495 [Amycolatopsis regifaucium]SFJ46650.1 hypothetical protein SAMN04489731_12221 [Amycolatopsis regifaucium]